MTDAQYPAEVQRVCAGAVCLLEALRPWAAHGDDVRTAAVKLTLALATLPEPTEAAS